MNYLQQDALEKLRKAAINASVAQKIALRDFEKAQAELDKWTKRYELALQESNKALASQAKYQKERYQAIADRLKNLIQQQVTLTLIKNNLSVLKNVKEIFKIKADLTQIVSSNRFDKNCLQTAESLLDQTVDSELELLRKELDEM
ncbi:MAG: hypothetical protein VKN72_09075 [Nostocales cyanobacterium 94392]|nr:hypothetical protein [Nostocales cyanobacterium 94392]